MTLRGSPCTSCRFYDMPCSIPIDRRGKGSKVAMKAISEAQNLGERLADKEGLDTPKAVESVGMFY